MPVEFLTDERAEAYGRFSEEPTRPELERFFFLDDVDRDLIALRRTKHHQLGFALQMVITHWPDMLRVAGSLVTNQVRAYDLLRMFGHEGHMARRAPSTRRTGTGWKISWARWV